MGGLTADTHKHVGPYHADYNALIVNASLISGCALAIADVMTPAAATMDNMAIFSVQPDCVKQRVTTFDVSDFCL